MMTTIWSWTPIINTMMMINDRDDDVGGKSITSVATAAPLV